MTPIAKAFLHGLIDYAGLFPPAGLSLSQTVRNYADYQQRPDAWALARLVVPLSRLGEFEQAIQAPLPPARWPLSALVGADLTADHGAIADFNQRHPGDARIESLEVKVTSVAQLDAAKRLLDLGIDVYCEVPLGPDVGTLISALKPAGLRAKVRTGGITPGDIPAPEAVLAFLSACAAHRLPFKATAGLHHPVRGPAPLTYEPNAPCATMFGYLNMIAASAALWHRRGESVALAALTLESRPDQVSIWFSDDSVDWGGVAGFSTAEIVTTRREFMLSIGSCSFTEPMEEIAPLVVLDSTEVG